MRTFAILILIISSFQVFADGIKEGFEVDDQDIFNGIASHSWIGDLSDFKISSSAWPYGSTPDFSNLHSLRSQGSSALNSTILTDISSAYSSTLKMRWEIFVSGSSVGITLSKGFSLILFVDSNEADSVELGKTQGYRIRLADPSGTAYPDGLYFEKADGVEWNIIDSVHTGSANINQGWKIVVERDVNGQWLWGYKNGLISNIVSLTDTIIDNEFTTGAYAGINWYSIASSAGGFGCDEFIVNPYTPGLWKSDANSTAWNNSSNWDDGIIPNITTNVRIATGNNQAELAANGICNNLTINPNSGLTIKEGFSLTINEDLMLESDSLGNASIIDHGSLNVGGKKAIKCYFKNSSGDSTEYHFFSSPLSPQNIENYFEKFFVYAYNESLASWYGLSYGDQFEVGKGYSVYNSTSRDTLICFEGEFNTGDILINISKSNDQWNLIGNPFPSAIDWDLLDKTNIESSVYMWNPNSLSYSYYNNGVGVNFNNEGLIAPMQAFFVRALNSGQLTIPQNSRCISNSQTLLKNSEISEQIIRLSLVSEQAKDETVIRFKQGSRIEYEQEYDALKLLSKFLVPQIYSIDPEDDGMLSINTLPLFIDSCKLELGVCLQKDKQYSIQLEELSGFEQNTFLLEGLECGSKIMLGLNDTIRFTSKTTEQRRLKLKIVKKKSFEEVENLIKEAYQKNDFIIVNFSKELIGDAVLEIYSLDGKRIRRVICIQKQQNAQLPIPRTSGIYIINLHTEGVNHSIKINITI